MDILQPLITILSTIVSILLTIIGYQYKVLREQWKTLNAFELLIHEPGVLQKLYVHMLMDDPLAAKKERYMLEQRISEIEEIIDLMATKKRTQKLIDLKIKKMHELQICDKTSEV